MIVLQSEPETQLRATRQRTVGEAFQKLLIGADRFLEFARALPRDGAGEEQIIAPPRLLGGSAGKLESLLLLAGTARGNGDNGEVARLPDRIAVGSLILGDRMGEARQDSFPPVLYHFHVVRAAVEIVGLRSVD